jgi:hypothetical protein
MNLAPIGPAIVEATAAQLPVDRVHDGDNGVEILPVVIAAIPDTAAREDLAEDALAPAESSHHAVISSALILGEWGSICGRRITQTSLRPFAGRHFLLAGPRTACGSPPTVCPAAASRIIANPRSARAAATR